MIMNSPWTGSRKVRAEFRGRVASESCRLEEYSLPIRRSSRSETRGRRIFVMAGEVIAGANSPSVEIQIDSEKRASRPRHGHPTPSGDADVVDGDKSGSIRHAQTPILEANKSLVRKTLEQAGGNHTQAAKMLGLHPNNLHRLMRSLNLRAATRKEPEERRISGSRCVGGLVPLRMYLGPQTPLQARAFGLHY